MNQREKRSTVSAGRKSRQNPAQLTMPGKNGGTLKRGGTNPGAGRPPDAFRELCRQLASGERTVAQVQEILQDAEHPQFIPALKWATEHGYGKPKEQVEHSGAIEHRHQVWKLGNREVAF